MFRIELSCLIKMGTSKPHCPHYVPLGLLLFSASMAYLEPTHYNITMFHTCAHIVTKLLNFVSHLCSSNTFLVLSMLLFGPVWAWLRLVLLLASFISSVVFNVLKEKYKGEKNILILLQFYTNSDLSHITKCSVDDLQSVPPICWQLPTQLSIF